MILAEIAYEKRSSISAGLYSISNLAGTFPGFSMICSRWVIAAAALDTSISLISIIAPGLRAILSRLAEAGLAGDPDAMPTCA